MSKGLRQMSFAFYMMTLTAIVTLALSVFQTIELDSERSKRIGLQTTIETIYKYHPELLEYHTHLDISVGEMTSSGFDLEEIIDSVSIIFK